MKLQILIHVQTNAQAISIIDKMRKKYNPRSIETDIYLTLKEVANYTKPEVNASELNNLKNTLQCSDEQVLYSQKMLLKLALSKKDSEQIRLGEAIAKVASQCIEKQERKYVLTWTKKNKL